MQEKTSWLGLTRLTLISPSGVAVLAGLGLRALPLGLADVVILKMAYELAKPLMAITGMATLGIWLYSSGVTATNMRHAVPVALLRRAIGIGLMKHTAATAELGQLPSSCWTC